MCMYMHYANVLIDLNKCTIISKIKMYYKTMRNEEEDTLLPTAYLVQLLTSLIPMPGITCSTKHIPKPPIQEQVVIYLRILLY